MSLKTTAKKEDMGKLDVIVAKRTNRVEDGKKAESILEQLREAKPGMALLHLFDSSPTFSFFRCSAIDY
jgi:hypothetical protein